MSPVWYQERAAAHMSGLVDYRSASSQPGSVVECRVALTPEGKHACEVSSSTKQVRHGKYTCKSEKREGGVLRVEGEEGVDQCSKRGREVQRKK